MPEKLPRAGTGNGDRYLDIWSGKQTHCQRQVHSLLEKAKPFGLRPLHSEPAHSKKLYSTRTQIPTISIPPHCFDIIVRPFEPILVARFPSLMIAMASNGISLPGKGH